MNNYIETYTKGLARSIVVACGELNALDAWRLFSERGHSLRKTRVNALMNRAMWLREVVQAKDLELAIASWETDIQQWEAAAAPAQMSSEHRMLALEVM